MLWLEDQIIRHYKIEDREGLRNVDSVDWVKAFQKYCRDIDCPISPDDILECLEWIAGFAVRLEYFDDSKSIQKFYIAEMGNDLNLDCYCSPVLIIEHNIYVTYRVRNYTTLVANYSALPDIENTRMIDY